MFNGVLAAASPSCGSGSRRAGIGVGDLVIARDLDDLSQRLARRQVDFVLESVFPMLALRERSRSLEPALLVVRRGQREYRSVFFTRQESPIQKPRRPARPHARAAGDPLDLGLRAAARRADAGGPPARGRRRRRRRPARGALRAGARRGEPGGLGAARQGRRRRLQRGRLAGAAREGPRAAAHLRAQPPDPARPDRVPRRPRAGDAARGSKQVMLALHQDEAGRAALTQRRGHHALRAPHARASARRCSTGPPVLLPSRRR